MGNSKSEILKEEFRQKKYKTIKKGSDRLMGPFEILAFREYPQNFFLKKQIDPQDYDQQAQIDKFVANLSQQNKYIAEFYFVYQTSSKKDIFDLVFEYGNQMQNRLAKEKYIWDLIEQVVEGMIVLEQQSLHYPFIHGRFILQESSNKFKLVNPYCFENYLRDVLHIYLNPMVTINKRKSYCQQQILKNIRELGCLVLVLLGNFDEIQIYENPQYRRQCIGQLKTKKPKFYEFLDFIFDTDIYAMSFHELKEWQEKNMQKASSKLMSLFKDIAPSSSNKTKPYTQQFPKKQLHKIFSNEPVKIRNTQDIGKEIQKIALQEERQKLIEEVHIKSSKKTGSEDSIDDKLIKKNRSDEKINQHQEPRFSSLGQSNIETKFLKNEQEQNLLDTDLDNLDFFNDDTITKQLRKRNSINQKPIINSQTDLEQNTLESFNFLNSENQSSKNINNFLKQNNVKKQIQQSGLTDQKTNIDSDLQKDMVQQEQVAKFIEKNYQTDSVILIEKDKPIKILQDDHKNQTQNQQQQNQQKELNQNFSKQKQPEKLQETKQETQQEAQQDVKQNNFQPPSLKEKPTFSKNTSQIQKIAIRWNKDQQKYFKEVQYKDGTSEVLEMDEKESIRYSQMGQQRTNSLSQKHQQNKAQVQQQAQQNTQETYTILLYPQVDLQPLLVVKTNLDKTRGKYCDEYMKLVDRSNQIKATIYHKVQQEGIDIQKLTTNCKRMKASVHITRDQYNKQKL